MSSGASVRRIAWLLAAGVAALLIAALAALSGPAPARADLLNGFQCAESSPDLHFDTVLPDGTFAQPYDAQLGVSGGTAPYTWEVSAGSWPAGLTMSSSGEVSGVPLTAGDFQIVVGATDSGSPARCASEIFYLHLNNGTEGAQQTLQQAVNEVLSAVNGGSGGLTGCVLSTVGAVLGQGPPGGCH